MKRGGPLRRRSARAEERDFDVIPGIVRSAVLARARYRCEAQLDGCADTHGIDLHHRLRRSQGGPHTEANLIAVCRPCHRMIHNHPTKSYESGLLIASHDGAPTAPWVPPAGGLPSDA